MLNTDKTEWWWLLRMRLEDARTNKHRFDGLRTARHTLAMCWGREQKGIIILIIHGTMCWSFWSCTWKYVLRAASRYYHVDDEWLWLVYWFGFLLLWTFGNHWIEFKILYIYFHKLSRQSPPLQVVNGEWMRSSTVTKSPKSESETRKGKWGTTPHFQNE